MYITTFFALKKVRDKRKFVKNNFSYLNNLDKNIKKKGINNLIIKENKFNKLVNSFNNKDVNIKRTDNKDLNKNLDFKNIIDKLNCKFKNIKSNFNYKSKDIKKFTDAKFCNLKENKEFNNFFNFSFFSIFKFVILLFCVLNIIPFFNFDSNILRFASNIYVSKDYNLNIKDINNIYPVFNPLNYVLNNNKVNSNLTNNKVDIYNKEVDIYNKDNFVFADNSIDSIFNNKKDISVFKFNNNLNVNIKQASNRDIITFDNLKIFNYSSRNDIDFKELYNRNINLTKKSDKILLYNTHASESYKNSEKYKFDYTGTYRTRDERYNMLAIAKELQSNLIAKNINVIHNTTGHDYYKYTGSYLKSRETIKNEFKNHGNFGIIFDVHRDACGDLNYAPKIKIGDNYVANIMIVVGTGNSNNRNKYADDNIALAIKIQNLGEKIYPRFV